MAQAESSDLGDWTQQVLAFRDLVERYGLHGLLFQHIELCRRRAWFHANRIDYSHLDARMALGSVSHSLSKSRDCSVTGLMGISPDRIDWKRREVVEAKGSAGARRAVSQQTAFYAMMLMAATRKRWSAANEIIGSKKRIPVPVDSTVIREMLAMALDLGHLKSETAPPEAERIGICPSCSYRYLCGHD